MHKTVFLDWNGTLLNDTKIWWDSITEIFRIFNIVPPTVEEYFTELGGDYLDIYRSRGIFASRDELNEIYGTYYNAHIHKAELYPTARTTLQLLSQSKTTLDLISTQQEELALPLLETFDIVEFFSIMRFHVLKKSQVITEIVDQYNLDPQTCFYIGDSPSDIKHAKKAGINAIAFLNGFVPEHLVFKQNPDDDVKVLQHVVELISSYKEEK
ncbi:HAD hydrolase-like protein [Patescibacteria group bacterium AH-259-L07]|nr:HAD hydrolase-like protein [Patescibacteria group bacterium AH-259-L07]